MVWYNIILQDIIFCLNKLSTAIDMIVSNW